jgi:flagellar basal body-associated protein FliL
MLLLKKGGTHMSNKKKIKVTLAMVLNVLLTAVELYLQWQLSKSENEL